MDDSIRLFPQEASEIAPQIDALFLFICAVTVFFTALIFLLVVYFGIKYRRRSTTPPPRRPDVLSIELLYTIVPLVIVMVIFFWSTVLYIKMVRDPVDPLDIHVIGKQWMWKIQHPEGNRENNELHLPVGRTVQLTMASQDVIHSFYIPAFRIKQDVVPGRYTTVSFRPTQVGEFHLFCAEYCGTGHSKMIGKIVVMGEEQYQQWLAGTVPDESPAVAGARLFTQFGCITCHGVQGPSMAGLYGSQRQYTLGAGDDTVRTTVADEAYLRESILQSTAKISKGFSPIMPSYRQTMSEEQLVQVIAYIKSLQNVPPANAVRNVQEPPNK